MGHFKSKVYVEICTIKIKQYFTILQFVPFFSFVKLVLPYCVQNLVLAFRKSLIFHTRTRQKNVCQFSHPIPAEKMHFPKRHAKAKSKKS